MPERMRPTPGIEVVIPGRARSLRIDRVVLDFNGTLATDGKLLRGVAPRIRKLAACVEVVVFTADTFGTARRSLARLPVAVHRVRRGSEKGRRVAARGRGRGTVAIGNGANDVAMFRASALAVAVIGKEGAAAGLLRVATIVVHDINDALDLLLMPRRLLATLRR